jgi:hypothetical protein
MYVNVYTNTQRLNFWERGQLYGYKDTLHLSKLLVTLCTTQLNIQIFCLLPTQCAFMCFVWISDQSDYFPIQYGLVFITQTECDYCAVRTEYLNIVHVQVTLQQRVGRRPVTAEAWVRSQASPCESFGGKSGNGTGFSPSPSVFPRQCNSTSVTHTVSRSHCSYQQ